MDFEELSGKLTELGTLEDAVERRAIITEISDVVKGIFETNQNLTTANEQFEADNRKLQEYNMQLYLKVRGETKKDPEPVEPQEQNLKYEDLFNEKGEIK